MTYVSDTKDQELAKILEKLLPYQIQGLYLLQDIEKNGKGGGHREEWNGGGGVFDPLLFGGNIVLVSLMMMENYLSTRNENIGVAKKMRGRPKNTIVFSNKVANWRTEFERTGSHLRVLYHDGSPGSRINFYTTDIVVSNCLNLKKLVDARSKSIQNHDWQRIVVEDDMTQNEFILNLKARKKWVIGTPENLEDGWNRAQVNFMYAFLQGYTSAGNFNVAHLKGMLHDVRPIIDNLRPFGSKMVETISIELTDNEKQIYLTEEFCVKERLKDIKRAGKYQVNLDEEGQREEKRSKKERFKDLECSILRLREMATSLTLAMKKGNIEDKPELMVSLNALDEERCSFCMSELKFAAFVYITTCKHLFCSTCIRDSAFKGDDCPNCRRKLDKNNSLFSGPLNCEDVSSKVTELLRKLKSKSVVVSKFGKLLTWLESRLKDDGYKIHRLNKKMKAEEILETGQVFQDSSSHENVILLADMEAISGELDLSSINKVFFMEAVKANEENAVINHITGLKGKRNDIFRGAFRLVVTNAVEGKIVGLKGKVGAGFKELNMTEIENILT